jgi:hypothetical protein
LLWVCGSASVRVPIDAIPDADQAQADGRHAAGQAHEDDDQHRLKVGQTVGLDILVSRRVEHESPDEAAEEYRHAVICSTSRASDGRTAALCLQAFRPKLQDAHCALVPERGNLPSAPPELIR